MGKCLQSMGFLLRKRCHHGREDAFERQRPVGRNEVLITAQPPLLVVVEITAENLELKKTLRE